jgi:hypothetical protein
MAGERQRQRKLCGDRRLADTSLAGEDLRDSVSRSAEEANLQGELHLTRTMCFTFDSDIATERMSVG